MKFGQKLTQQLGSFGRKISGSVGDFGRKVTEIVKQAPAVTQAISDKAMNVASQLEKVKGTVDKVAQYVPGGGLVSGVLNAGIQGAKAVSSGSQAIGLASQGKFMEAKEAGKQGLENLLSAGSSVAEIAMI